MSHPGTAAVQRQRRRLGGSFVVQHNKLWDIKRSIIITHSFSLASSDPISSNYCNNIHHLVTRYKMFTLRGQAFLLCRGSLDLTEQDKKSMCVRVHMRVCVCLCLCVVKCYSRAMWCSPHVVSTWTLDSGLKEQTCQTRKYEGAEKLNTTCYSTVRRGGGREGGRERKQGEKKTLKQQRMFCYCWSS